MKKSLIAGDLVVLLSFLCWGGQGEVAIFLREYGAGEHDHQLNYIAGSFDGNQRNVSLPLSFTYVITCKLCGVDEFKSSPWVLHDKSVKKKDFDSIQLEQASPQVFYESSSSVAYLYLLKFSNSHSGSYACVSEKDRKGVTVSTGNPSITLDTARIDRTEGSSTAIVVTPILYGSPKPSLQDLSWFLDGTPLSKFAAGGITVDKVSSAMIISFNDGYKKEHTGLYTAVVNTDAGLANDSFALQVYAIPVITFSSSCNCINENKKAAVKLGMDFSLSCKTIGAEPSSHFTWFKDGVKDPQDALKPVENMSVKRVSSIESQLSFSEITIANEGTYYCKANNTFKKDTEEVIVSVQYLPEITPISPASFNVLEGEDLQLLVHMDGIPHPQPIVRWTHLLDGKKLNITANNVKVKFSGELGINLTMLNVTVADTGVYSLETANDLETTILQFSIAILVPPVLTKLSNTTVYSPTSGTANFRVRIENAWPLVSRNDISWSGRFKSDRQNETYQNGTAMLVLSELRPSDGGKVMLHVRHLTGNTVVTFYLSVLNPPVMPNTVSFVQCMKFIKIEWRVPIPPAMTARVDEIRVEQRACPLDHQMDCDQKWEVSDVLPSTETTSLTMSLKPDQYVFRFTSCSHTVGCGKSLILGTEIKPDVRDFMPKLHTQSLPLNSSSFQIKWTEVEMSECHEHALFNCKCWPIDSEPRYGEHHIALNLSVAERSDPSYTVTLTGLQSDSQYNCSVLPYYYHPFDNEVYAGVNEQVYVTAYTLPEPPRINTFEIMVINTYNGWIKEASLLLDMSDVMEKIGWDAAVGISHFHVIVLKLKGDDSKFLSKSPDELYASLDDFSTYQLVHSSINNHTTWDYRPYIAAEFNINDPDVKALDYFVIGGFGDTTNDDEANKRFNNGPLSIDHNYTVFVRFYERSQFGRQYSVFCSSAFSPPMKPWSSSINIDTRLLASKDESSESSSQDQNSSIATAVVCVSVAVFLVIFGAVIGFVLMKINFKNKHSETNES